nr:unnamed protein product [Spirometra erinaceieuropaei]
MHHFFSKHATHFADAGMAGETSYPLLVYVYCSAAELSKEDPIDISLTSISSTSSQGRISRQRTGYVPYRDSKLTWLLRDSLGGNSKTTVIATISPSSASLRETMNVLRFSQCIKMIKNYPMRNEDPKAAYIRKLLQEIDRLRVEVEGCRKWNFIRQALVRRESSTVGFDYVHRVLQGKTKQGR